MVGGELALAAACADDTIGGGGVGVDARAAVLFGAGFAPIGPGNLFTAARLGVTTDTTRYWPNAASGVAPSVARLWGPSVGVEGGWRGDVGQLDLTVDGALAGFTSPWRLDGAVGGTWLVSETVGLRGQVDLRSQTQQLLDGDVVAGRTRETELRGGIGVDLVF